VDLIACRVLAVDLLDYVRFRAVCPHWRSSTASPRGRGIVDRRFHPRRWMMLPEGHGLYPGHGKLRGFVRFFNLSTGAFVRVHLPLFRDHCVLDSIDGLLLLQRDHDTAARLLNPFTGDILDFPPLETLLPYVGSQTSQGRWFYIRHVNATSMNVSADGVVSLMIFGGSCWSKIVFATSREQRWRVSSYFVDQYSSPLSFQGKIYVLRSTDCYAKPEILEIGPPQLLQGKEELWMPPPRSIAKCPLPCSSDKTGINYPYLAECGTEMMVVSMTNNFNKLLVHRVADLMLGRAVPVTRIGGNCLFIDRRKLYVSSKAFPTIVDDTIVFYSMQKRMLAQYHLSSGTILPATNIPNAEDAGPSPCSIISHIYTCCYREKWSAWPVFRFQFHHCPC
jgi:hypothetical protein